MNPTILHPPYMCVHYGQACYTRHNVMTQVVTGPARGPLANQISIKGRTHLEGNAANQRMLSGAGLLSGEQGAQW